MGRNALTVVMDDEPEVRPLRLVDNPPNPFASTAAHTMQGCLDADRIHGWLQKPFVAHELFTALAAAKQASA